MKLSAIKAGETVFIDANIFIYHFTGLSCECREFLKECAHKRIISFTSNAVLAEVCHRLMAIEAVKLKIIKPAQPAASLRKNPALVRKLSEYYAQITNILSWGIQILPFSQDIFIKSQIYRQHFGLLTNDSFIPVHMESAGTANLASSDKIFASIPQLRLYSPSDIIV